VAKKQKRKPYRQSGLNSFKKLVECKCPKCEETHMVLINWTGTGMPKIFCPECKRGMGSAFPDDIFEYSFSKSLHHLVD